MSRKIREDKLVSMDMVGCTLARGKEGYVGIQNSAIMHVCTTARLRRCHESDYSLSLSLSLSLILLQVGSY